MIKSNLEPGMIVYDDNNASELIQEVNDPRTPYTSGYVSRNYQQWPLGFGNPTFSQDYLPDDEWDENIERQEDEKSSPEHWRRAAMVPILNQGRKPYCWSFGTVGAIMTKYAMTGIPVPFLSATAPAAQGKNFRMQGGWAEEAIRYIRSYGLPTVEFWPEDSLNRSLPNDPDVKRSAARHSIIDFEELPRSDIRALITVLLDRQNPRPVTLGLNWWGHLVYATKVIKISTGRYGILIVNSWGEHWKQRGTAVLSLSKATAYEQIAVSSVKLRTAA